MNPPPSLSLLFAQQPRLSELGGRFSNADPAETYRSLLLAACVLLILAGAVAFTVWLHFRERRGFRSPGALFLELCRSHALNRGERRLLRRLAESQGLDQPGRIFLEPERFDPARLNDSLRPRQREIERLRDRLFGRRLG